MTTNKPGAVAQHPLYCCTSCYEQCTYPADHLRVNDGECWCDLCWDERRWEFPDQPSWNDLEPYTPSLQTECEKLRKDAKLWESNHDEIHRRADKERALEVPDGWKLVPVEITDAMADASGCEGQFKISAHEQAASIWSAMLEAAPSHSQQNTEPSVLVPDDVKAALSRLDKTHYRQWAKENPPSGGYICGDVNTMHLVKIVEFVRELASSPSHSQQSAEPSVLVTECFKKLYDHARGMQFGTDWNNGTAALHHRQPLIDATWECEKWLSAAPSPSQQSAHPDDIAVDRFAELMKQKLAVSRGKGRGGWDDPELCHVSDLAQMLIEHIPKGDPVDIANFAMMLCFREGGYEALKQVSASAPSHSQKSARTCDDAVLHALEKAQPFVEMARESGIAGAREAEILMANVYDTVRDRCPSHDSEQGGEV